MSAFSVSPEQLTVFSNNLLLQQQNDLGVTYFFTQSCLCLMPSNLLPSNSTRIQTLPCSTEMFTQKLQEKS